MLQARIISSTGSFYFAAEATAYNLETLRMHIHDTNRKSEDVRLEVCVGETEAVTRALPEWLRRLSDSGVRVRYAPAASIQRTPNAVE